jgi:hypothetical protein
MMLPETAVVLVVLPANGVRYAVREVFVMFAGMFIDLSKIEATYAP